MHKSCATSRLADSVFRSNLTLGNWSLNPVSCGMLYSLFRLLHLIVLLIFAGALLIENMAIKPEINSEDARNLARVDRVCGMTAILTLILGLILWFGVGKPAEFYSANPVFHAKLGLFVVLAVLAIKPALFFFKQQHNNSESISVPASIRILLRVELVVLLCLPVLAFLMARGIGLSS